MSGRAGRRTVLDPADLKQWEEHLHDKSNDEDLIFVETKLGEKNPKVSEDGYKPGRKLLIEALVRERITAPKPPTPAQHSPPHQQNSQFSEEDEEMFEEEESKGQENIGALDVAATCLDERMLLMSWAGLILVITYTIE
jgi:hypothetical protein